MLQTTQSKWNIYHICNFSDKIIFRSEEDYLMAINRLASCAQASATEVWAYAIMSTHFHLIVRTANINKFLLLYKRNISFRYNRCYSRQISFSYSIRELKDRNEIITATNYVLKNPVHHGLDSSAFKYPYSSISCYYSGACEREDFFAGERTTEYELLRAIPKRIQIELFGATIMHSDTFVIKRRIILPRSFVSTFRVEALYKNIRYFLYNMNKPLEEEKEMFKADSQSVLSNSNEPNIFGKITDKELCVLIDSAIKPKTFAQLTQSELEALWFYLKTRGVDQYQFSRAT